MKKFLLTLFCLITFASLSAKEITETFKFSEYPEGTQYAKETHKLSENVTITIEDCYFTTQLRIYSSSTNNGYVISNKLPGTIKSMSFNAGNKSDKLDVYGSNDGNTWTNVGSISVTSSYKDYTLNFTGSYTHFKLDVAGTNQLRIASMSITYEVSDSGGGEENTPVDLTDEQFKWSDATAVATIGAANTFPALTNTENVPVEYSSSEEGVATIDAESGEITLVGAGETEISAVSTATEDYNSKTVTYTLTVNPASSGGDEGDDSEFEVGAFYLVSDGSTLKAGDEIIITDTKYEQSIGKQSKNTNNFSQTSVKCTNNKINPGEDVAIITLESAGNTNTFYLNCSYTTTDGNKETGYLYAASSSSNYLKAHTSKNDNSKALISIANDIATIKFQGTNTRNWIQYNQSSSLFACYAEDKPQKDIAIFRKYVEAKPEAPTFTYEGVDEKRMEFDEIGVAYIYAQDGCTIYYTINGNDPTTSSTEYDGTGVYVDTDTTIKAVAVSESGAMSEVAEVTLILFVPEGVKYSNVDNFNSTMTRQSNSNAGGYGFILCGEIDGTLYAMSTQSGSNVIKATEANIRVDGNIYLVGDDQNHYEFYINNSGNNNYYLWSKDSDNVNVISTDVETNSLYLEPIANAEANGRAYLCKISNAESQPASSAMHKAVSGNEVDIVFDNKNTVNLIGLYRDDVNGHYFGANTILADEPFEKVYLYASEDGQTTGVENVIDELTNNHAEVEFYNLQGVRVDKPAAGIYIRRQGNTAVKILVK